MFGVALPHHALHLGSPAGQWRGLDADVGNGGNFIFVFPTLDLVVALTRSNYNSPLGNQPFGIIANLVLPAVN